MQAAQSHLPLFLKKLHWKSMKMGTSSTSLLSSWGQVSRLGTLSWFYSVIQAAESWKSISLFLFVPRHFNDASCLGVLDGVRESRFFGRCSKRLGISDAYSTHFFPWGKKKNHRPSGALSVKNCSSWLNRLTCLKWNSSYFKWHFSVLCLSEMLQLLNCILAFL